jgi:hypothetical protein
LSDSPPPLVNFKIVYETAEPELPSPTSINAAPWFAKLVQKVASQIGTGRQVVQTDDGEKELWLSKEVHGLLGTDGRRYLIDLCE